MQGAAISAIKIDGVLHEFSALHGVYEDVPEIVLNIKGIRFKITADTIKPLRLDRDKEGEVVAGDIELPAGVEILNPEHHLCTMTSKKRLVIEMELSIGKGFSIAEEHRDPSSPISTIAVDAIHSPVKQVNYSIEPARVGQKTDYDRLILEITTDGSISPRETIAMASRLLIEHFTLFLHPEMPLEHAEEEQVDEETQKIRALLRLPVDELELSVRASNCLRNARIRYLVELVIRTEQEMLKFRNFGRKSLNELQSVLSKLALHFGMDVSKFITADEIKALHHEPEKKVEPPIDEAEDGEKL
jgi:DNA-directed RNA polymerase subunit alpha